METPAPNVSCVTGDGPPGSTPQGAGSRPTGNTETQPNRIGRQQTREEGSTPSGLAPAGTSTRQADVPGYELLGELGRGGMGVVYKARQTALQRVVALKMILSGGFADPETILRFQSEALAVARLQHPNIVQIFDSGTYEQQPYFSMEYVDGCTLSRWMADKPQAPRVAAAMVETLARAIHYAHENGIIHRDLKPANVLLNRNGQPKITDFGLAKLINDHSVAHTMPGNAMGTPEYMAPEQIAGEAISPATDVYTLGVILYEMFTGRRPFEGDTKWLTLERIRTEEPVSPVRLRPSTPRDLETICLKCLRKEPGQRYATAQALANDLSRFLNGEPIHARPASELERAWRWCKRKPLVACLLAALVTVSCTGFLGITWNYWKAEAARREEQKKREEADASQKIAVEQRELAETNLYYSRIALAGRFLEANDVAAAKRLLTLCIPPEGGRDQRDWEWRYLEGLCHQELFVLEGHTGHVFRVTFSPDGRYLASAGGGNPYFSNPGQKIEPGEVILWDAASGSKLHTLRGHEHLVNDVAFSPDGLRVASASHDATFKVWDVTSGKLLLTGKGHGDVVLRVFYSPSGKYLATVGRDKTVKLWDATTAKELESFAGESVAFSPDEEQFAIGGGQIQDTKIWSVSRHQQICTLAGGRGDLAYNPKSKALATGWPIVRTWDVARQHATPVATEVNGGELQFSGDGAFLLSVKSEHLFVHDAATGRMLHHIVGHNGQITSAAFSPDGKWLATAGADQTVRIWDLETGKEKRNFRGHAQTVNCVAFHPNGRRLASAGIDGTVRVWDRTKDPRGLSVIVQQARGEHLKSLGFSADGRHLLTVLDQDLEVWEASTGDLLRKHQIDITEKFYCPRGDVSFSADGRLLAAPSKKDPCLLKLWDTAMGKEMAIFQGSLSPARAVALSANGKWLAGASRETVDDQHFSTLTLWDVADRSVRWRVPHIQQRVSALAFSADGHMLAAGGSEDGTVRVLDVLSGRELLALPGSNVVLSVVFSRDGSKLAAADFEGEKLHVWDLATGQELFTIPGLYALTSVAFSPNGRRLVATGYFGDVRFWDTATGQESFTLNGFAPARQGDYAFTGHVVFSADGRRIASNNWDGSVNIWEAEYSASNPKPGDRK